MKILTALSRANRNILKQKFTLMEILTAKHGLVAAKEIYKTTCPIVKASIGQHFRHSLDHIESAVLAAAGKGPFTSALAASTRTITATAAAKQQVQAIHYDQRVRGGLDENDWDAASERMHRLYGLLEELVITTNCESVVKRPVEVSFMLSGDCDEEFPLISSAARELGFAAHHAIHHLAMVRIIAECDHVGQLRSDELPEDFGRAPSTVNFDRLTA